MCEPDREDSAAHPTKAEVSSFGAAMREVNGVHTPGISERQLRGRTLHTMLSLILPILGRIPLEPGRRHGRILPEHVAWRHIVVWVLVQHWKARDRRGRVIGHRAGDGIRVDWDTLVSSLGKFSADFLVQREQPKTQRRLGLLEWLQT
jgi:hypothetical protein